jgi:hypothetical protein
MRRQLMKNKKADVPDFSAVVSACTPKGWKSPAHPTGRVFQTTEPPLQEAVYLVSVMFPTELFPERLIFTALFRAEELNIAELVIREIDKILPLGWSRADIREFSWTKQGKGCFIYEGKRPRTFRKKTRAPHSTPKQRSRA